MKVGITVVGLCFLSTYLMILFVAPTVRDNQVYVAASIDKESRLEEIHNNRLVFVGGSNLALGINSEKMASSTGRAVINMGLHAGLGLSFPLNEALFGLKKGDVVVLSIEYFLSETNFKLAAQLIDVNPEALDFFSLSPSNGDLIRLYIQSVQRCISALFYRLISGEKSDPIYNRYGFSKEGDLTSHFGKPGSEKIGDNTVFTNKDYSSEISKINDFIVSANKKGAIVFFTYPSFSKSAYMKNIEVISKLSSQYNAQLKCPILGNAQTFVLSDRYFFDTTYHLDSLGIQKRTGVMISILPSHLRR